MSIRQYKRCVLLAIGLGLLPLGVRAQEDERPAPILRGGFVQQLRSLSEDAIQALDRSERRSQPDQMEADSQSSSERRQSAGRPTPGDLAPQATGRSLLPSGNPASWLQRVIRPKSDESQSSDDARASEERGTQPNRADAPAQGLLSKFSPASIQTPQTPSSSPPPQRFPSGGRVASARISDAVAAVTPDRSRPTSHPRDVPGYTTRVHVETELPTGLVPQSKPVQAKPVQAQTVQAQTVQAEKSAATAPQAMVETTLQQAPRVSRVPLPTRSKDLIDKQDKPKRVAKAAPQPLKTADSPKTVAGTEAARPAALPSLPTTMAASPKSTFEDGGVSVPTKLVAVPKAEQTTRNSTAPLMPSTSAALPQSEPLSMEPPAKPTLPAIPTLSAADFESTESPAAGTQSLSDSPQLDRSLPAVPALESKSPENALEKSTVSAPRPSKKSRHEPQADVAASPAPQRSLSDNTQSAANVNALRIDEGQALPRSANQPQQPTPVDELLRSVAPRVQVTLNGPDDLPVGKPAEYRVVVKNDDSIDLHGLILRLDFPAGVQVQTAEPSHGEFDVEVAPDGLTLLTWGFENLTAGASATAPIQLIASSPKNFAVAMEWTLMPLSGDTEIEVLAPRLELALQGPAEVSYGQPNIYHLSVRNPGNAVASNVVVNLSAEPYGSSSADIGQIAPGQQEVIDVELTFNQQGPISIVANAQAENDLSSSTGIDVIVRQAHLHAELVAPQVVYHGATSVAQIRVTNSGDADARSLQATVQLPAGTELISAPANYQLNGRELTWPIAKLPAGSAEEFALQFKLSTAGANVIDFACSGKSVERVLASAETHVEAITDLKLIVNDPVAPAPVGGEVPYELTLTNRGSKAASNVRVIAQFSEGIEPTRGVGQASRVVPGQLFFEPIPRIAAGEAIRLQVYARAETDGVHRFRVEVRSDESDVRLVQEESTQYLKSNQRIAAPSATQIIR